MNRTTTVTSIVAVTLIAVAGFTLAGPLNPPVGPVASTMKTMTEVEPRIAVNAANTPGQSANELRITQPGSYYLPGNLNGLSIMIVASDVTLDLNGFRISGGSVAAGTQNRIVLRNGSIISPTSYGVGFDSCSDCTIEDLNVANSGSDGIRCGKRAVVRRCHITQAGQNGLYPREDSRIEDCTAAQCVQNGFAAEGETQFIRCTASRNTGDGFNDGWMFESCTALHNTGRGFYVAGTAINCRAAWNNDGFTVLQSAERCTASHNAGIGFNVARDATVRACRADGNTHQGFRLIGSYGSAYDCVASGNGGNSQAGIWINGSSCHVEGNHCIENGWGIFIDPGVTGNYVVGNTCSSNPLGGFNAIPASNSVAPIVNNPGFNVFATTTPLSNIVH
ncbi:MAG: right-handed parallel beta-helix repeat-containing protein [Phycisphaerales bacterium]